MCVTFFGSTHSLFSRVKLKPISIINHNSIIVIYYAPLKIEIAGFFSQLMNCEKYNYTCNVLKLHTHHSRFILEGVAEASQIILRDRFTKII
jgi:hypothetical protein